MSAPDRPTQTQLNATLRVAEDGRGDAHDARLLAVEVRALRAELDGLRIGLDVETRRADDWQRVADGLAEDAARAALVARTQPAEPAQCSSCDGTEWACYACQAPHEGWLYEAPRAPLPAVPDGEDEPDWHNMRERLHTEISAIVGVGSREDRTGDADGDLIERVRRAVAAPTDGEDVPARLDAAADVLNQHECDATAQRLRDAAAALRAFPPNVRAAVAAALARPTERER